MDFIRQLFPFLWGWYMLGGGAAHSVTTKTFDCRCWDFHTHAPTPMPRVVKYVLPTHSKVSKLVPNKKGTLFDEDSYDY